MCDKQRLDNVKQILLADPPGKEAGLKAYNIYYHNMYRYELLQIDSQFHVIVKRKKQIDAVIYCLPVEDYYEIILEAHVQSGIGGRDEIAYYFFLSHYVK